MQNAEALLQRLLDHRGDRRGVRDPLAIARALSVVIDHTAAADALLTAVRAVAGHALVIGVTGPPGAGKSTLVDCLISAYREAQKTVAVLAVDPSSPITGGATLGDRVRMQAHAADPDVFIRSLATRGHLGGVTATAGDAVAVLDAAGFDIVIVETVGVGQGEVDIARLADVCVVVLVPGTGDDVQALKAGLMEIADIFVVNKADRDGADRMVASIEAAQGLVETGEMLPPPVLRTIATTGDGIPALVAAIDVVRAATRTRPRWRAPHERAVHLDHVAVAVHDPAPLLAFLRDALGIEAGAAEDVADQRVRVRFAALAGANLEVVEPIGEDSPIAPFLARRGPGLHHVAIGVEDLSATLAGLKARGVRLIDEQPRVGAHGRAIAFVHPSSTGGVLVELIARESVARAGR